MIDIYFMLIHYVWIINSQNYIFQLWNVYLKMYYKRYNNISLFRIFDPNLAMQTSDKDIIKLFDLA